MDNILESLGVGFGAVLTLDTLGWIALGVVVGVVVGALPGLGAITGMVLLFPLTFTLDPLAGIAMLAAVYFGVMYGGTVGGILLNMPGTDQAIPATFEGYPLALKGRAGPALVIQAAASFAGATFGVVLLTLLAPYLGFTTRNIGPPEFFLIILVALMILAVVLGDQPVKGLIAVLAGFCVSTVGMDIVTGQQRFTFGQIELIEGLGFVPVTIGVFAVGEILYGFYLGRQNKKSWTQGGPLASRRLALWPSRSEWGQSALPTLRASVLGFIVGLIPGTGASVAANGSYAFEKAVSKRRHGFGKGEIAGLASPSAADNAAASGSMLPTLVMGIPGSAAMAVLLGGLVVMGVQPGPLLMTRDADLAWGVIASMYVSNVMLTIVCIAAIPIFARVVLVPYMIIGPIVIMISVMGAYFAVGTMFGVWVMAVLGVVGFFMKRFGFSPAAFVIAMVLAPLAEVSLRQSLTISDGSPGIFFRSPLTIVLSVIVIGLVVTLVALSVTRATRGRKQGRRGLVSKLAALRQQPGEEED